MNNTNRILKNFNWPVWERKRIYFEGRDSLDNSLIKISNPQSWRIICWSVSKLVFLKEMF